MKKPLVTLVVTNIQEHTNPKTTIEPITAHLINRPLITFFLGILANKCANAGRRQTKDYYYRGKMKIRHPVYEIEKHEKRNSPEQNKVIPFYG